MPLFQCPNCGKQYLVPLAMAVSDNGREMDVASTHRMRPGLRGQRFDGSLEFSARRGAASSEPTTEKRKWAHRMAVDRGDVWVITAPFQRVKDNCENHMPARQDRRECIFCGSTEIIARRRSLSLRQS